MFGYTYGSETLPQGHWELYQWATFRSGKADGRYHAADYQTEIEYGFTDRLQGSLYLNAVRHDVAGVSGFTDRDQFRFNGIQGSLKYRVLSPYKDGCGLAYYLEPGYQRYSRKSGEREDIFFLEAKVITQKNFLDDTVIWAANFSAELERAHDIAGHEWETELELGLTTGLSYRFAPGWSAGAEAVFVAAFERADPGGLGEYGVFLGPSVHYARARWWFTATTLAQVSGWPGNSGRNLDNFEKLEVRLKLGLNF